MPETPERTAPRHEITIWRGRPFLVALVGFFAFMTILFVVVGALTTSWTRHTWPLKTADVGATADPAWNNVPPQLQTHAANDLKTLREQEDKHLHTVKWIDDSHTYAVIPIDDAMRLLAQAQGQITQVLPAAKPATPIDLQVQKSSEASPAPREP